MSPWQVLFHVVPQGAVAAAPSALTPGALENTPWWLRHELPVGYRDWLSRLLPPDTCADADAECDAWGNPEGNRIEVRSKDGRVASMKVLVDVRKLDSTFGAGLILLLRSAQAVLVRRDGLVVEPVINAYAGSLRSSNAWRYASDPAAWIAEQAAKGEKIVERDDD